jgi:hypothetical protein
MQTFSPWYERTSNMADYHLSKSEQVSRDDITSFVSSSIVHNKIDSRPNRALSCKETAPGIDPIPVIGTRRVRQSFAKVNHAVYAPDSKNVVMCTLPPFQFEVVHCQNMVHEICNLPCNVCLSISRTPSTYSCSGQTQITQAGSESLVKGRLSNYGRKDLSITNTMSSHDYNTSWIGLMGPTGPGRGRPGRHRLTGR